jgi:hypothetical protein
VLHGKVVALIQVSSIQDTFVTLAAIHNSIFLLGFNWH